jgi:hypothetical protein
VKSLKLILSIILFSVVVAAQDNLPVIKSNVPTVSIQDGEVLQKGGWTLTPEAKPDVYEAQLIYGKPHKVTFLTDVEQISFVVEEGKKYDFVIQWGDKLCYTRIVGTRFIPAAIFDKNYQARNKGKVSVEIPEVYELVNVAIAMTPTGIADKGLVDQDTDYYKRMRAWFDKYQNHPLLAALDAELKKNARLYFSLKNNGYAFEFDKGGKIVQSKIYDRTAHTGERTNALRPYVPQLQSFSDQTNFRRFYKENRKTYQELIAFYRDVANIPEMIKWLNKNFPGTVYDSHKIIFSPLVGGDQSVNWIESNGFRELQAHILFFDPSELDQWFGPNGLSEKAGLIFRGNNAFTEINHGYINLEADKYADRITRAISNRDFWVDKRKGPGYYRGLATFNEYMNWGLVSLRIADYAPKDEQDKMIAVIDRFLTKGKGFLQFEAFDKFLINLYRTRKPDQTLADLYPHIIDWFEKHNAQK